MMIEPHMTTIELYLTASIRFQSRFMRAEDLAEDLKKFGSRDTGIIMQFACPRDMIDCDGFCPECWQTYSRKIREDGVPEL